MKHYVFSLIVTIMFNIVAIFGFSISYTKTNLYIVYGSGEFETLETGITVTTPEAITLQWTTTETGATGGTWKIMKMGTWGSVVKSGETGQAPSPGHFARFTLNAAEFLLSTPPGAPVKFYITVTPHGATNQPLGNASSFVTVTQVKGNQQGIYFDFDDKNTPLLTDVVYPSLEITSYKEKIGIVENTQLHYAEADLTLRVSNKGKKMTDTVSVDISDQNLLMRQSSPSVIVHGLEHNDSKLINFHLVAILPPPTSQLSEDKQYSVWNQKHADRCAADLGAYMIYAGKKSLTNTLLSVVLQKEGWSGFAKYGYSNLICDEDKCVKPCEIAKNIHKELDGHVMGYTFFVGQYPQFEAWGQASDVVGKPILFTSKTKITVASVSKLITAIAAVRILDKKNISLDSPIGPFLPSDWSVDGFVAKLTFAQLLRHESGIKDYGNGNNRSKYASLKSFFCQSVNESAATQCMGPKFSYPFGNGINPKNLDSCYSNFNYAIFRILLPKIAGFPEDMNWVTRPGTLADQYVRLVQQNVFDLVGQKGVVCKPQALNSAFGYTYPPIAKYDWGDLTLSAGGAGWYLSVEDMAKVLLSINANDGKILTATATKNLADTMRIRKLGWDLNADEELEKNGLFNYKGTTITTSVAIFGPVKGPRVIAILFINSNIAGGPSAGGSAVSVLTKAYQNALSPKIK